VQDLQYLAPEATDELSTDEICALVRENPHVNWVDLTGGEIFLRPDIDAVFDAILAGWSRLALLHFPTNGFQTDRIVRSVERWPVTCGVRESSSP
jgi:molybdenum cofactor biosynthesis enzyme MoaA